MAKLVDLTGQNFGRLTVLGRAATPAHIKRSRTYWSCVCTCGKTVSVESSNLRTKSKPPTQSCGCLWMEQVAKASNPKHGMHNSPTYKTWQSMKYRCTSPKATKWKLYGARGITVCERWMKFENFLADMGERPAGKTIDRIDSSAGYFQGNCRWATISEQNANRRTYTRRQRI